MKFVINLQTCRCKEEVLKLALRLSCRYISVNVFQNSLSRQPFSQLLICISLAPVLINMPSTGGGWGWVNGGYLIASHRVVDVLAGTMSCAHSFQNGPFINCSLFVSPSGTIKFRLISVINRNCTVPYTALTNRIRNVCLRDLRSD